jgi:N-acetylneuraminic acid mutarotase
MKRSDFSVMSLFSNPSSVRSITKGLRSANRSWMMIAGLAVIGFSCNNNKDTDVLGNWVRSADLEGVARSGAAGFSINNKAYMGTGVDGENNRLKDFWSYDPVKNTWTSLAEFPGAARANGSGFTAGSKGYIGLGSANSSITSRLKDFYEYDPVANKWTVVADEFPGSARHSAVSFSIGDKGYVGTGYDGNYLNDIYAFSATTKKWTKAASYSGPKRRDAIAMVINNIAYVGCGNNNTTKQFDWWAYDPSADQWNQKLDFTSDQRAGIARNYAVTFVVGGKGYLGFGDGNTHLWSYDPQTDLWTDVQDISSTTYKYIPTTSRWNALAFGLKDKDGKEAGYVMTGTSGSTRLDDNWKFEPAVSRVKAD